MGWRTHRGIGDDEEVESMAMGWRVLLHFETAHGHSDMDEVDTSNPPTTTALRRIFLLFCFHLITNNSRRDYPSLGTIYSLLIDM